MFPCSRGRKTIPKIGKKGGGGKSQPKPWEKGKKPDSCWRGGIPRQSGGRGEVLGKETGIFEEPKNKLPVITREGKRFFGQVVREGVPPKGEREKMTSPTSEQEEERREVDQKGKKNRKAAFNDRVFDEGKDLCYVGNSKKGGRGFDFVDKGSVFWATNKRTRRGWCVN